MRVLKGLVLFLAIIIFVGLTIIAIEISDRYRSSSDVLQSVNNNPNVSKEVRKFGKKTITIKKGTKILGTNINNNTIVLRLSLPGGNLSLLVIDINTGERIGQIMLQKEN